MLAIYRASAGSGKTYTLTQQYIDYLLHDKQSNAHRRILAVTFTHKATNEMKSRIIRELNQRALSDGRIKRILVRILQDYSAFAISTIDSFFQQVLRAFAREMGQNGSYALELDTDEMLSLAIDNLFFDLEENPQLLKWLTEFAEENIENGRSWNLRSDIEKLGREIFKENYQAKLEEVNEKLHDKEFLKSFNQTLRGIIKAFEGQVRLLGERGGNLLLQNDLLYSDFRGGSRSAMGYFQKWASGTIEPPTATFETFADAVDNCYAKGAPTSVVNKIEAIYGAGLQPLLQEVLTLFTAPFVAYTSAKIVLKNLHTLGILSDISAEIRKLGKEQNSMLISNTNRLLGKLIDGSDAPFIFEKIGTQIHHFMIDEFQDTSAMQWHIFKPLIENSVANGSGNMLVGDVKQSIYRWRNSDWSLLGQQVEHQIANHTKHTLERNWRSAIDVVAFNNKLFDTASSAMQELLNSHIEESANREQLQHLTRKIEEAYKGTDHKGIVQQPQSQQRGYVQVRFVEGQQPEEEEKLTWQKQALTHIPAILSDVQARGTTLNEVAFLVRRKEEARWVTEFLMEQGYDVVSNEGLLVGNARTIRFIMALFRLLVSPHDAILRLTVNVEYAIGRLKRTPDEALKMAVGLPHRLFTEQEEQRLAEVEHLSLFDMSEQIIALFELDGWHNESAYIQAFQDIVYNYTHRKRSDINSFLDFWEKQKEKLRIPTPEMANAVQVLTIHKSKGLEFHTVVVPFCDWSLDSQMQNTLWSQPQTPPFNLLPLVPISYSAQLKNSCFAREYYEEQMNTYMDSLNMLYVACTRPKQELYCLAPMPKPDKKGIVKLKDAATLLYQCVDAAGWEDAEQRVWSCGERLHYPPQSVAKTEPLPFGYTAVDIGNRVRIKQLSSALFLRQGLLSENRLNLGTVMHDVLCQIRQKQEQEQVLHRLLGSGKVNQAELEEVRRWLDRFWAIEGVEEWFKGAYKVLNEVTILQPNGKQLRPDRVMIAPDGSAIVVDYKFGAKEPKHHKQVAEYMQLMSQMGYRTEGYLCYVELGQIVPIVTERGQTLFAEM